MSTALHYLPAHLQTRHDPVAWSVRKVTLLVIFGPALCWSAIGLFVWWVIR